MKIQDVSSRFPQIPPKNRVRKIFDVENPIQNCYNILKILNKKFPQMNFELQSNNILKTLIINDFWRNIPMILKSSAENSPPKPRVGPITTIDRQDIGNGWIVLKGSHRFSGGHSYTTRYRCTCGGSPMPEYSIFQMQSLDRK